MSSDIYNVIRHVFSSFTVICQANNCHAEALEFIESKRETLPHLESELKVWEKKAKAFTAVDDLKAKVNNLKNELVWTLVAQVRRSGGPSVCLSVYL